MSAETMVRKTITAYLTPMPELGKPAYSLAAAVRNAKALHRGLEETIDKVASAMTGQERLVA